MRGSILRQVKERALLVGALTGLAAGGLLYALGEPRLSDWAWGGATALVLAPTVAGFVRRLWQRRAGGVDVIAALAMGGALALGELLAGAIIAVMLTGGNSLERLAARRARRELTALLARAPQIAHRKEGPGLVEVPVESVGVGDLLVVKPGEVVPADGICLGTAVLDESALTGEARPLAADPGTRIRSGASNAGGPFDLRVTAPASQSTYAGIVRLVRAAESSKAPFVRLADRYARWFLPLTLGLASIAWLASGDPVRALAVLVVATPCPLLLAAPAAIIAGVSRAARHGLIIKGGAPLEALARAKVLLLDKTGTLTTGIPRVVAVEPLGTLGVEEVVRLAASAEQLSTHPFVAALLAEARDRGLPLCFPQEAQEQPGLGIEAMIEGRKVAVGQLQWVAPGAKKSRALLSLERRTAVEGASSVFLAVDGKLEGGFILQDPIRAEAPRVLRALRRAGMRRIHLVTGDHPDIAELVGDAVGVDRVFAERAPSEKVAVIQAVSAEGPTVMVGDGVNDAPALALASVGVAMGARGATVASEAAEVVLTVDRLEGLWWAVKIAQRTRGIALQSVGAGMGMSLVAMVAAAAGLIPPVAGAVLQEGIDVAVLLNALRALGGPPLVRGRGPGTQALAARLRADHQALRPRLDELGQLVSRLDELRPAQARVQLEQVRAWLFTRLLPHEEDEQERAYPVVARMLEGEDPTYPLIQTHQEIHRLIRLFSRLLDAAPQEGPGPDEVRDLRRALAGLHAILTLHMAQEEDFYSLLGG